MTKNQIRKVYKAKRAKLSAEEIEEKSMAIANQLLALPVWEYQFYHLFLSITQHKEVDTEFVLHILSGKDKNIVVSKSDFKTLEMQHFLLTDATPIKINEWGIPEPQNGIEIKAQQIEVVFIPLLAFDLHGNRIGYGKGFYDRFLENCSPKVIKIGLSFYEAEAQKIEASSLDVPLDYCVMPERVYRF
ncbi:5-formyltetrahydrofolate cyclo-ligase [Mesonia ostreae]|uniref:5-formyltetrahydrofolate cyclo-ligase n=1 Tax=Mesonia ostreae TaxID=861110 RepID=A0ABU2KJA0_9FLAO|nr:5-formyltetrahydrofolate cyclo-ligase [Mesonia ostreae]MDT0294802.1 5-formyltetrahydrofolate cyclo-ligase [Mesonia ostreae]